MIGERQVQAILEKALHWSKGDQTEALLIGVDNRLTRFANSAIHQNVVGGDATLHVRAVVGKRIGEASTNDFSDAGIKRAAASASEIALVVAENPEFVSLPGPLPIPVAPAFASRTADATPEERARAVGVICGKARGEGLVAAGAYSTDTEEMAVANSLGSYGYHIQTVAELSATVMSDDSAGYGYAVANDLVAIDPEAVASEAMDKARRGRNPLAIPPGEYEVILEGYAVQDILQFLAAEGLNALAVKERRSFMINHFGQRLVGDNITIYDDGLDPRCLPMPFDFEGVPKQRVTFFERGIAQAVVYDSYLAFPDGRQSTGHALPSPIVNGPLPLNVIMEPGDATAEKLIRDVKRGLWVTRFWYTRPVEPVQVIVTGMTRDGTFLIENGEIVGPVKNLRFTQGYVEALNNVSGISKDRRLIRESGLAYLVPSLKIDRWQFVSATDY